MVAESTDGRFIKSVIIILAVIAATFFISLIGFGQESIHGQLKLKCETCHTSDNSKVPGKESTFNHSGTKFPLTGAHNGLKCVSCHKDLKFKGTSSECVSCHEDIHNAEFGKDCAGCHETSGFTIVEDKGFHDRTLFPLNGFHRTVKCSECHNRDGHEIWKGTPSQCVSCHYETYLGAKLPDHKSSGFGTDCAKCHSENGFKGSYNHDNTTFPLTGAHSAVKCSECHGGNVYTNIDSNCKSCHIDDYNNSDSPNHIAAGFPSSCENCHNTNTWVPSSFDHASTGFTLTGGHSKVSCSECHKNDIYAGIQADCISCHQNDFVKTSNPAHSLSNSIPQCETCHSDVSWSQTNYQHTATFALTGAHQTIDCNTCHGQDFTKKPSSKCYDCHLKDYNSAGEHLSLQFPTDCESCHTTAAFSTRVFKHTGFSIYSGTHKGKWHHCADCHNVPGDFSTHTCSKCHSGRD